MKKIFIRSFALPVVLCVFVSCQKDDSPSTTLTKTFNSPTIEAARNYFNANSKYANPLNYQARSNDPAIDIDWDNSKEKKYKDEPAQTVDILYTPLYLETEGNAKAFVGSIEQDGQIDSKIFILLYTSSAVVEAFSGYALIYNLDGTLNYGYQYSNGQRIAEGIPTAPGSGGTGLQRNASNCPDPFESMDCLLDWIGGDWFGLDGFIQNDEVVIEVGDSSTGGTGLNSDSPFPPSIEIPYIGDDQGSSGGTALVPWWNSNTVQANGLSILVALEIPIIDILPEVDWILNQATLEQWAAIADYLNANRVKIKSSVPSDFENADISPSQLPEISEEAVSFATESVKNAAETNCVYILEVENLEGIKEEYDPQLLGDEPDPLVQQDHEAIKTQYQTFIDAGNIIGGVNYLINSYSMETFGSSQISTTYSIEIVQNIANANGLTICEYDAATGNVISCNITLEEELINIEDFGYVTRAIKHELYHVLQAQAYGAYNVSEAAREFDAYYASIFRFPKLPRVNDAARLIQLVVWFDESWDAMTDEEKEQSRPTYDKVKAVFPEYCDD